MRRISHMFTGCLTILCILLVGCTALLWWATLSSTARTVWGQPADRTSEFIFERFYASVISGGSATIELWKERTPCSADPKLVASALYSASHRAGVHRCTLMDLDWSRMDPDYRRTRWNFGGFFNIAESRQLNGGVVRQRQLIGFPLWLPLYFFAAVPALRFVLFIRRDWQRHFKEIRSRAT